MALHKETFITRSLSAIVFVVFLLGAILYNYTSFTLLFFIVSLIALKEFMHISNKLGAKPYQKTAYVLAIILYTLNMNGNLISTAWPDVNLFGSTFVIVPFVILAAALFDKRESAFNNALFTILGLIYAVCPFILLNKCVIFKEEAAFVYNPMLLLGTIFIIWINDTFAYIGGSFFGKHKMIARISPGKTWEGTVIGVVLAFAVSFSFKFFLHSPYPNLWPVLGLFVPILATLGDLVESMLKRKAGVKDSGNLMPGHGGALDRFDSLIFVSPFLFALLQIIA